MEAEGLIGGNITWISGITSGLDVQLHDMNSNADMLENVLGGMIGMEMLPQCMGMNEGVGQLLSA
jgi:hypothetical protein